MTVRCAGVSTAAATVNDNFYHAIGVTYVDFTVTIHVFRDDFVGIADDLGEIFPIVCRLIGWEKISQDMQCCMSIIIHAVKKAIIT